MDDSIIMYEQDEEKILSAIKEIIVSIIINDFGGKFLLHGTFNIENGMVHIYPNSFCIDIYQGLGVKKRSRIKYKDLLSISATSESEIKKVIYYIINESLPNN